MIIMVTAGTKLVHKRGGRRTHRCTRRPIEPLKNFLTHTGAYRGTFFQKVPLAPLKNIAFSFAHEWA
jgi:hypothetical protein